MNNKSKNKALFFVNSLVGGGAERAVLNLCEQCNKNKIIPIVVSLYKENEVIPKYIEHYCLDIKRSNNVSQALKICTLGNAIKSNNNWNKFLNKYNDQDFILISAHLPMSHKLASLSPFSNKTIYTFHLSLDIVPRIFRPLHNKILTNTYKGKWISCVCNGIKNELISKKIVTPNNTKTIYNPIKVSKTKNTKSKKPYILMAGRLTKIKNQNKAIKLFCKSKLYNNYDLIIAGEGPLHNKLQKEIDNNNMRQHIKLIGYQKNIEKLIANASLLLSTSKNEAFGMVLAEALMLNTPVVSTIVKEGCTYGPSEILTGRLKKFLVPLSAKDNDYINTIKIALEKNYPDVSDIISNKFEPRKILKDYINFYSQVCSALKK